jgi:hypothetical protein
VTVKLSISVPDDVADYLRETGNASAAVTEIVRPHLSEARRQRQREAARAMAEHLRERTPPQVANDDALREQSNDAALADSAW